MAAGKRRKESKEATTDAQPISSKRIVEEILEAEGPGISNDKIARIARTKYEVDVENAYVSGIKSRYKKRRTAAEPRDAAPEKKASKVSKQEKPRSPRAKPASVDEPKASRISVRNSRPITLDDVIVVEKGLAKAGLDLKTALTFVRGMSQTMENVEEILEWLLQREK